MKTLSLRRFTDTIKELDEPVEVVFRGADGAMTILGQWTPAGGIAAPQKPASVMDAQKRRDEVLRRVNRTK